MADLDVGSDREALRYSQPPPRDLRLCKGRGVVCSYVPTYLRRIQLYLHIVYSCIRLHLYLLFFLTLSCLWRDIY